ncbi:Coagulation factor IX [Frankliniella fusca]|uniref:Coagulation factor IX n=1 Tax=Frankliniella fusca TaxID=407009 RepID=A0AAE1H9J8_9NEOP|nr:Coagulation factor IX [Frankliniella fusca]
MSFLTYVVSLCSAAWVWTTVLADTECGIASAQGQALVIDGRKANSSEFPWHVGLYVETPALTQVCGGSLVQPRVVITAAHCAYRDMYGTLFKPYEMKVSLGSSFRDWNQKTTEHVQRRNVTRLFPHPRYRGTRRNYADDVAILELDRPIEVNAYVLPICVDFLSNRGPSLQENSVGKVVGWGTTNDGKPSPVLQSAEMPFIPFETCERVVPAEFVPFLTSDKFCAGHVDGAQVARGDSGGGLALQQDGRWFLAGVVSVGVPNKRTYAAFTRLDAHITWINEVLKKVKKDSSKGYEWVPAKLGDIPCRGVAGGLSKDGEPLYVGRFPFRGLKTSATIIPSLKKAIVTWGLLAHESSTYEVLCLTGGVISWGSDADGKYPAGALSVSDDPKTPIFVCRIVLHSSGHALVLGKMSPGSHCYIPTSDGREDISQTYDVLVLRNEGNS